MKETITTLIDPEDIGAFILHYIPTVVLALVICAVFLACRSMLKKSGFVLSVWVPLIPVTIWIVYFCATAKTELILSSLGSESANVAENAYRNFDINLDQALRIVKHQIQHNIEAENIRFYAACRIADLLSSNSDDEKLRVLKEVSSAPIIEPGFIGTNALNSAFYLPGQAQPQLRVNDIIVRRLIDKGDKGVKP